jgi:hypothetical protein
MALFSVSTSFLVLAVTRTNSISSWSKMPVPLPADEALDVGAAAAEVGQLELAVLHARDGLHRALDDGDAALHGHELHQVRGLALGREESPGAGPVRPQLEGARHGRLDHHRAHGGLGGPQVATHHVDEVLHHGERVAVELARQDLGHPGRLLHQQPTGVCQVGLSFTVGGEPVLQSFAHVA